MGWWWGGAVGCLGRPACRVGAGQSLHPRVGSLRRLDVVLCQEGARRGERGAGRSPFLFLPPTWERWLTSKRACRGMLLLWVTGCWVLGVGCWVPGAGVLGGEDGGGVFREHHVCVLSSETRRGSRRGGSRRSMGICAGLRYEYEYGYGYGHTVLDVDRHFGYAQTLDVDRHWPC